MNIPLAPEKKFDSKSSSFFTMYSLGLNTNRDTWVYNSSVVRVADNMASMSNFYNNQVSLYKKGLKKNRNLKFSEIKDNNPRKIKWARGLENYASSGKLAGFSKSNVVTSHYRPFCKQALYYDKLFIEMLYQIPKLFPNPELKNLVICVSGVGVKKEFSCLISDEIPNLQILANAQCFPLYYYEEDEVTKEATSSQTRLLKEDRLLKSRFLKKDGISDYILEKARKQYKDSDITKKDIFYYVYGILHHPDYRITFSHDLKKKLPRIPLVDKISDFWRFSESGKKLADLHLNYETIAPYHDLTVTGIKSKDLRVSKMRFPQKDQKDTINYNSKITISGIPEKAYQYVVNGRSAIEWIMERYQISTDAESGIVNDPNDWAAEVGNPRYILDLLLSIINLSVQTVDIVEALPKLKFESSEVEETNKPFF
jgi:predicted helicase